MHSDEKTMPSSAAARFASLPELLRCVADHILCSEHLKILRFVSKNFNNAATPVLFREASPVPSTNFVASSIPGLIEQITKRDLVKYVRSLTIRHIDWNIANRDLFPELLAKMPRLESFTASCPLQPGTISALHQSCPKLKALSFDFEEMEERVLDLSNNSPDSDILEAREKFMAPDITLFANLEKLSLLNLYGDLNRWRDQVAKVLKQSPKLNSLALSLSVDAISRLSTDDPYQYWSWFESVCRTYEEEGGLPLPLHSLHCGTAIFPQSSEALKQLIDLNYLEEVYVKNEDVWSQFGQLILIYNGEEKSGIVFDTFVNAPNLRCLRVKTYAGDVHRAFCTMDLPSRVHQIAISAELMDAWYEPAMLLRPHGDYPSLPLHPRMLEIELDQRALEEDGQSGDTLSAEQLLETLVDGDEGALEGLVLCLPDPSFPKDDEDDDECPRLEEQYELFERTLPKLTNLSQLCISGNGYGEDACSDVSHRLARAIPSLRYISFNQNSYRRIIRDGEGGVTLMKLEGRAENEEVELHRVSLYRGPV